MRTAKEAAKAYKQQKSNRPGMCLWEVQEAFRADHLYPNAIGQWNAAKDKHPGDRTPPIGAPVYWSATGGNRHGHIAIYVGDGMCRSSDAGGRGLMGTKSISWFEQNWGGKYLGWTGDIGGQTIDFDNTIHVYVAKLKPGVDDSDSVKQLRYRLIRRGFLEVEEPLSEDRPGNKYTGAVEKAIRRWQKKKGYKSTGVLNNKQTRHFFEPNPKVKVHPE